MSRILISHFIKQTEQFFPVALLFCNLSQGKPCPGELGLDLQGVLQLNARFEQIPLFHQRQAFLVILVGLFSR